MNQILISQKLYVTPDMKRKKKLFKFEFFLSVFLFCIFSSYYIYAEYDRNKSEGISKEILDGMKYEEINNMESKYKENNSQVDEDVIRVILNKALEEAEEVNVEEIIPTQIEIPEQQKSTAKDGTEYYTIGKINIPSISVNYPILSSTTTELLKISPCKFWGAEPNQIGNLCIVGHNYRNSKFFSKLSKLEVGDIVEITDLSGTTLTYYVYDKYIVEPTDLSCTSQNTNGQKEITLITCTNDNKQRTVIKARAN